jgi:hypothetical protein
MTDYHPLIARAVEGLEKNSGEARRALYERARAALVSQLRAVEPALPESEITRERLSLEDAIRKVEAEAARRARTEPRPAPPLPPRRDRFAPAADGGRAEAQSVAPPAPRANHGEPRNAEAPRPAPPPSARDRALGTRAPSLSQQGAKGFRNGASEVQDLGAATAKAAQSARDARDSYGPLPSPPFSAVDEDAESPPHDFEPQFDADESSAEDDAAPRLHEPDAYESAEEAPPAPRLALHGDEEFKRPPRSYRGIIQLAVAVIILAGIGATVSWQWPHITGLYQSIAKFGAKQQTQTAHETTAQPKFPGRVPQEQSGGQAAGGTAPGSQTVPAVAQRVVLYEEDANDPQGKRFAGSVIWHTETISPGSGLAPELAVRADVEIPERHMTMTWSLRRNTDKALPASHTIEIMFTLPPDFPGGAIANVPGVLMKQSEQARGTPLAGLAVKVTNGFFLVGLSAGVADLQRNIELLKERPWFDIPIVYTGGGRAILAMEKGPPGDRAFAEAFAAWEKK